MASAADGEVPLGLASFESERANKFQAKMATIATTTMLKMVILRFME
ncbi:hypothetical protein [Cohnella sp. REN36]